MYWFLLPFFPLMEVMYMVWYQMTTNDDEKYDASECALTFIYQTATQILHAEPYLKVWSAGLLAAWAGRPSPKAAAAATPAKTSRRDAAKSVATR